MNRSTKRILSVLLAVVLVPALSAGAFADEENSNAEIVFFGDSVTQAWGPNDFYFAR